MMKESVEYVILETIKKHSSMMPLFKAGYPYSKIMKWGQILEEEGKLSYDEMGCRVLTKEGEERLKLIKKNKAAFSILPLSEYRVSRLGIDEVYLP